MCRYAVFYDLNIYLTCIITNGFILFSYLTPNYFGIRTFTYRKYAHLIRPF
ncbi:MAG: hypothetical protein JWP71_1468 [Mucilaginibacter sp.]|nr:hypothetical protein [Mucilaginibacter sp.]